MARKLPRSPATPPKRRSTPYGAPASLYSAPTTASMPHRKIPTSDPGGGKVWSNRGIITYGSRHRRKIPTSDPHVKGATWSDHGIIKLSRGDPNQVPVRLPAIKASSFQQGRLGAPAFFKRSRRK